MFRNTFIRFLCRIVLLSGLSAAVAVSITQSASLLSVGILVSATLITAYKLIRMFNDFPQKMAYFFNAVENEDSMLYFSEKTGHKPTATMHKSLNRINRLIREAKLKNREQEQYYSLLLEQTATGIVVVNAAGSVMQANSAAKRLLNYTAFNHIEQLKRVDEDLFYAFLRLKEGKSCQFVKTTEGNTIRQLSLQATSFESSGKILRVISIQDISNELDTKEIESWMKLIRVLTHEIMNSITPITSLSETLLRYYIPENDACGKKNDIIKGLEVIHERGKGLIRFVDTYRKLTKLAKPELQTVELKKTVEHLLLLLENEPGFKRIDFSVEIIPENLSIQADEVQMSQVFINLIKNAIYAVDCVSDPKIRIYARHTEDGRCEIAISDNGSGIPRELLGQVFIPFFTTKAEGNGIGLSLSRQIVKNHGGHMEVASQPGNTRFTFYL